MVRAAECITQPFPRRSASTQPLKNTRDPLLHAPSTPLPHPAPNKGCLKPRFRVEGLWGGGNKEGVA